MATKKKLAAVKSEPEIEAEAADAAPPRARKSRLMVPLIAVLALAGIGAGAWFGMIRDQGPLPFEKDPMAAAKDVKKTQGFVPLEPFTVNLQDRDRERYLQLGVVLETNDGAAAAAVKQKMPVIRSQILLLLSSKKGEDLQGIAAKEKLALDIIAQARMPLEGEAPDRGIERVHFSSFIVQ